MIKRASFFSHSLVMLSVCATLYGCGGGGDTDVITENSSALPTSSNNASEQIPDEPRVDIAQAKNSPNNLVAGSCDGMLIEGTAPFKDISDSAGLCYSVNQSTQDSIPSRVAGGIAVNDINADGLLDFYVTHGRDSIGQLFTQRNDGSFENITSNSGINVTSTDFSANFLDIDEDGDQDLITMIESEPFIQFFENKGNSLFEEITEEVSIKKTKWTYSMAAGDIDLDGDLDLFFAHWDPENKQSRWEFMWQRLGSKMYQDISESVELEPFGYDSEAENDDEFSFTPIFADINDDAFPDLLVAADWGTSQYLVNNGSNQFVDQTIPQVITDRAGMGAAVADYDNDGDLDWFVSAIGDPREQFLTVSLFDGNRLYNNDGDGNFLNYTDFAGVRQGFWAWGSCFADFNNDGFEDIYVVNGYEGWDETQAQSDAFDQFRETPALLYINQKNGRFEEQAEEFGLANRASGRGLACLDYDRDGDIDILISNSGASPTLYRNDSDAISRNFINVRLTGLQENPQAVGARIYVTTGDNQQLRELQLGNHYVSQNPVEAHFGLDGATKIDEIRIVWPGRADEDTYLYDIPINRFINVYHPRLN